jgi:hypothetical protein
VIESQGASVSSPFEASLEAEINAESQTTETSWSFQYSTSHAGEALTGSVKTLAGSSPVPAGKRITEGVSTGAVLAPGTTYYFRALAENAAHEAVEGKVQEFTTLALTPPSVEGESALEFTAHDARLRATVNPDYQATTYEFKYATQASGEKLEGTIVKVPGGNLPAGSGVPREVGPVDIAVAVPGTVLAPETPYFWRVIAKNETGTIEGKVETFTTLTSPTLTTGAAREVTRTSAVLSGTVDPLGVETSYVYVYATQQQYERGLRESPEDPYAFGMSTAEFSAGSVNAVENGEPVTVEGLTPGETYHYALLVTATQSAPQGSGVKTLAVGPDQSFRTEPPLLPIISETGISAVGQSEATLTAKLNPNGLSAHWELLLGTTPGELQYRSSGTLSAGTGQSSITVRLESLSPGSTYYYKLLLVGAEGSAETPEGSFMTQIGAPVQTLPLTVFPQFATLGIPTGAFPKEEAASKGPSVGKPTKAQKLKAALAKCGRQRSKKKRTACERTARKRYGGTPKPKHARKRG